MTIFLNLLRSPFVAALVAIFATVLFYEGLPTGPFGRIPGVGPLLQELTDGRVDRERKAALVGFVHIAELEAATAKAFEKERQRAAAQSALEAFEKKQLEADAADAIRVSQLEQEIADNEKLLAAKDRSCILDSADLEFLSKPAGAAKGGRR